jgi:hypothetical protein
MSCGQQFLRPRLARLLIGRSRTSRGLTVPPGLDPRDRLVGGDYIAEENHVRQAGVVHRVAARGVAVLHEQDVVAHLHRVSHRRLAAAVRGGAGDDQRVDAPGLQERVEIARARNEGAPPCLRHNQVLLLDVEAGPQGMLLRADGERRPYPLDRIGSHAVVMRSPMMRLVGIELVLDVGNSSPGRPERLRHAIDVLDDAARDRHLQQRPLAHEADLEVDHDMRGPGRVDYDLMMAAAHPGDAIEDFGGNVRLMHGWG